MHFADQVQKSKGKIFINEPCDYWKGATVTQIVKTVTIQIEKILKRKVTMRPFHLLFYKLILYIWYIINTYTFMKIYI